MDYKWRVRRTALAALVLIGGIGTGCAQTPPDNSAAANAAAAPVAQTTAAPAGQDEQAATPALPLAASQPGVLTADEAKQNAAGNVAELQQMLRGSELAELRTTYNGSYGASLLFYGKEMTYYVALFQQKNFWRVIKTPDERRADLIYRDFARQTVQLSDVEIRRSRLEAQKAFTERMIAL